MSIEKEKLIHRAPAFEGRMLHVFDDEVEIHGHKTTREVVLHPGASAIIPVTGDGEILFVRQYRYAVEQPLLEIPAGKLDGGEDPDTCAARELTEETGYKTEHMEKLGYVYTTPGFCNETIHLYLADHLVKSHQISIRMNFWMSSAFRSTRSMRWWIAERSTMRRHWRLSPWRGKN